MTARSEYYAALRDFVLEASPGFVGMIYIPPEWLLNEPPFVREQLVEMGTAAIERLRFPSVTARIGYSIFEFFSRVHDETIVKEALREFLEAVSGSLWRASYARFSQPTAEWTRMISTLDWVSLEGARQERTIRLFSVDLQAGIATPIPLEGPQRGSCLP